MTKEGRNPVVRYSFCEKDGCPSHERHDNDLAREARKIDSHRATINDPKWQPMISEVEDASPDSQLEGGPEDQETPDREVNLQYGPLCHIHFQGRSDSGSGKYGIPNKLLFKSAAKREPETRM